MKVDIWDFSENLFWKIYVLLNTDENNGTLHKDVFTFMAIPL
jgi:CRISPR/Cas system CMR-associated protein Cmr1 (group 7 of RAMP superfamily)